MERPYRVVAIEDRARLDRLPRPGAGVIAPDKENARRVGTEIKLAS
jgi:hypothetical protein